MLPVAQSLAHPGHSQASNVPDAINLRFSLSIRKHPHTLTPSRPHTLTPSHPTTDPGSSCYLGPLWNIPRDGYPGSHMSPSRIWPTSL